MEGKLKKKIIIIAVAVIAVIAIATGFFVCNAKKTFKMGDTKIVYGKTTIADVLEDGWETENDLSIKNDSENDTSAYAFVEKDGEEFELLLTVPAGKTYKDGIIDSVFENPSDEEKLCVYEEYYLTDEVLENKANDE